MNIFYLDPSPITAAQYQCDKHIVKMPLEAAQLLSTAHRTIDNIQDGPLYKIAHLNHPCSIWTRASDSNYQWLFDHFIALSEEYERRYNKEHSSFTTLVEHLYRSPVNISTDSFTEPPQCMPDEHKQSDTVAAYRAYYHSKSSFAAWNHSPVPHWWSHTKEIA